MAINKIQLFSPKQMAEVDRKAIESGFAGPALMERAGAAVAAVVLRNWPQIERAVILCGPGNNGGDGHVAARHLDQAGVPVCRFGMTPKGNRDAVWAYGAFPGAIEKISDYRPQAGDVVIDALFGAGLDRALGEELAALITQIVSARLPVLAVDLPSGLSGRTGRPTGPCFKADVTVTFAGLKPGHVLLPGRQLCGTIELADIGIPARYLINDSLVSLNHGGIYQALLPVIDSSSHKYGRGHLAVFSGPLVSGSAARMAACAGLRAGAGLVTLASPPGAVLVQANHLTAVMQRSVADISALEVWLEDTRLQAFVLGPGFGDLKRARDYASAIVRNSRALVLDADGLSAFAGRLDELAGLGRQASMVITPHEGEFRRLFGDLANDGNLSKIDRAQNAASMINGVVVHKGADCVIAAPDGRVAVNVDGPSWLATAGSGDVLAGIIGAYLVQGMPAFEAACAGVAEHSAAARRAGPGMTAEDLIAAVGRS